MFACHREDAGIVKVAEGTDNGGQPASVPALPRPASPVPDTFGHAAGVGTHDSAHPPRYGPAVLRALGRVQVTRARIRREQFGGAFSEAWVAHDDALKALWLALDEDRAAAVPALPDESERDVSPHRFGGIL